MLSSQLKRDFTCDEIERVMSELGSDQPHVTTDGDLIFQTICHNPAHEGSHKLYYYKNSGRFQCYTACGNMDVYELIQRVRHCSFRDALVFLREVLHLQEERKLGFSAPILTDDWDILNRYASSQKHHAIPPPYPRLPSTLLGYYPPCFPAEWEREGITKEVCADYDIRFDVASNAIIIPHKDKDGGLIGIRSRSLDEETIRAGFKYMPTMLEGKDFRHTLRYNLYGLWKNAPFIRKARKVMLVEAEKSVLQCASFYGDANYTLAVCGSNISTFQRDLVLSLGVQEVFIAFDKEYEQPYTEQSDAYANKLIKLASIFTPYTRTCVLFDTESLLDCKDSPTDKGKVVLEELLRKKYEIKMKE